MHYLEVPLHSIPTVLLLKYCVLSLLLQGSFKDFVRRGGEKGFLGKINNILLLASGNNVT